MQLELMRLCLGCGADITGTHWKRKTCSPRCHTWVKDGHKGLRDLSPKCAHCRRRLVNMRSNAIYCGRGCKNRASEIRRNVDDRARYLRERERRIAYARKYQRENPEVPKRAKRKRKARMAGAGVFEVSRKDWLRLVRRHGGGCFYCGAAGRMSMDHVVPISRGGTHSVGNLVPACISCNSQKKDRTIMEWRMSVLRNAQISARRGGELQSVQEAANDGQPINPHKPGRFRQSTVGRDHVEVHVA